VNNIPCLTCPWLGPCFNGNRNEDGGAPDDDTGPLTTVGTCFTCCEKAIAIYTADTEAGGTVPENCPRWHPTFGSALDCGGCQAERQTIRRRHPQDEARSEALKGLTDGLLNLRDWDELKLRRAAREWVNASLPAKAIEEEDMDDPSPLFRKANAVFAVLQQAAMDDVSFGVVINSLSPSEIWRWDLMMARWAEALYLAVREHGNDAEGVAREYRLTYTDGLARRAWRDLSVDARLEKYKLWVNLIEQAINFVEES